MTKKKIPVHYIVSGQLSGMNDPIPANRSEVVTFHSRNELASFIRATLRANGFPPSRFRDVQINAQWFWQQKHGSGTQNFWLEHNEQVLAFRNLSNADAAHLRALDANGGGQ